ncbi:ABC transporter substrate-binding protein [Paraconexibacter antarcticus]|uniref:ABC transporter substrate-binding protein n=1 Tax=Paraconexibacter antarcticus TaxID=2949664 RepID=A0ABY5DTX9_9ACTN|nr:ABC transporter substrate-binding protein [Paraconexibacter antarcticus]UTI64537.1 ABC transporter substrate-binding protein [Paraconexibacter antarcticus]
MAASVAIGACGSNNASSSTSSGGTSTASSGSGSTKYASGLPASDQKKGGTLKVLSVESFQHLDPGTSYFQLDFTINFATHRALYYHKPDDSTKAIPDLADGPPQISADGKTLTVKLKSGIKYGTNDPKSPINGKEVTAADVKYAFERGLNPHIANGYESIYFPLVGGAKAKGGDIAGITTPDAHTIVFKFTKNAAATAAKALVLPLSIPVPKSVAGSMDKKNPSTYDADPTKQAFTGPYMISQYSAGKSLTLVRNPQWDGSTDSRPAYLDKMTFAIGADPNVAGQQVFASPGLLQLDTPAAPAVKKFATQKPQQITFSPLGNRWVSLNYTKPPFNNVNVRKAAIAIMDRTAMQRVRGGAAVGDVASHFLSPGIPGFDEAGGMKGEGQDYVANPSGDATVAAKYMKAAGYASGKAPGTSILMIGDNSSPAKEDALIVKDSLEKLGFKVQAKLVEHSVFYSKYCQQKAQLVKIDVCANFGWLPDFFDPYAMLYVNFSGKAIVPVNGNNPSLFNDPAVNAAMDKAATIADDTARAKAWGAIDKMLVDKAAAVPWFWDKQAGIASSNVVSVIAKWNADADLSYVSLK